jgi:hypothetical protein
VTAEGTTGRTRVVALEPIVAGIAWVRATMAVRIRAAAHTAHTGALTVFAEGTRIGTVPDALRVLVAVTSAGDACVGVLCDGQQTRREEEHANDGLHCEARVYADGWVLDVRVVCGNVQGVCVDVLEVRRQLLVIHSHV